MAAPTSEQLDGGGFISSHHGLPAASCPGFWDRLLLVCLLFFFFLKIGFNYASQAGFELVSLLSQPPKC